MKRWLAFILAVVILIAVHEGAHAATAALYDEFAAFRVLPFGFEVVYRTPLDQRQGVHWALISGVSNLATLLLGYRFLSLGGRFAASRSWLLKSGAFYLTFLTLLADPFNLSLGAFIYGGDANGIAAGLGVSRYLIQAVFFLVLLVNRELIAHRLFPLYAVKVSSFLFQPWIGAKGRQA